MQLGDITVYTTHHGQKKVAIVVDVHDDGRVSLFVPPPTFLAVERSAKPGERGTCFDPTLPEEVVQLAPEEPLEPAEAAPQEIDDSETKGEG